MKRCYQLLLSHRRGSIHVHADTVVGNACPDMTGGASGGVVLRQQCFFVIYLAKNRRTRHSTSAADYDCYRELLQSFNYCTASICSQKHVTVFAELPIL